MLVDNAAAVVAAVRTLFFGLFGIGFHSYKGDFGDLVEATELVKDAEFVALIEQPFEGCGQDLPEFGDAAQGVVEGNDAAVARIATDVGEHFLGGEAAAVVAGYEVPHDDAVALASDGAVLHGTHPSVGWAEEVGLQQFVGLLGVFQVFFRRPAEAANVVEGVVADAVASVHDLLENLWVFAYVVANHKEGGVDAVVRQHLKDEGRCLRDGTVVEGQVDSLRRRIHAPDGMGINPSQEAGRLLDYHINGMTD